MTGSNEHLRLAPRGVVRGAAWSLDVLRGFGEPELHRASQGDRCGPPAAFERAYLHALERERACLWNRALDEPLFVKGLLLSSPSAYQRMQSAASRRTGPRNRAMRLVEDTLYRYLARAATRVTPQGLWAGVTEIRLGAESRIERVPPRCHFTPDLRPFQRLIRGLGLRDEYRARTVWRLNPSLQQQAAGGWAFFHRTADGTLEQRHLSFDPSLARLLAHLETSAPMSLVGIGGEFAQAEGSTGASTGAHAWLPVLHRLADGGVLVGGLDLPAKFETAWEALDAAADRLLADNRRAWRAACASFRESCAALADGVWSSTPDRFAALVAEPAAVLAVLAQRLGLPPPAAGRTVRCDLQLPWRLTLSHAQYRAMNTALVDYDRHWLQGASAAAAQREYRRQWFTAQLAGGRTLAEASALIMKLGGTSESVWAPPSGMAQPEVAARLAAWESCLRTPGPDVILSAVHAAPSRSVASYGCWLAGLGAGGALRAHGVSDLPTLASARYAGVLGLKRHNQWLRAALAAAGRHAGVELAEFCAPCEANPNALASPALLGTTVAPWDADARARSLCGARLHADPASGQPVLRFRNDERNWAVLTLATADLQTHDPFAEALLWTGYRDSPGRTRRAVDVPTAAEFAQPCFTPRVTLPRGSVLCPRRTVLAAELATLRRHRGVARFWYWQQLAARFGWPALLEVASDRGGAQHVPRDSPLAVEALCKGLTAGVRYLLVQEVPPEAGFPIPGRGPHMVELAIPFLRRRPAPGSC